MSATNSMTSRVAPPRGARPLAAEGAFQSLGQGVAESYLTAFALSLGAGGIALGLVASLPTAAMAFAQALARRARYRIGSVRNLVLVAWSAQSLVYPALGLCALLTPGTAVPALLVMILLCWGAGGLAVPAWTSLVSAVVPRKRHGWFFGLRGTVQQVGILAAILGGGALLGHFTERGSQLRGFMAVFVVAGVARGLGTALISGVPSVHPGSARLHPESGGVKALKASRKLRKLVLYLWVLHFGTHVATPFFLPYMIRELRLSYVQIGLLLAVPAFVKIFTMRIWGRLADRAGPGPLLRWTGWQVGVVPLLWLVSGNPWWILVAQIYAGLIWGAFELAQASALLQTTRGREGIVAFFNLVDGGVMIAGSLLGGLIVHLVPPAAGFGYTTAMAVSGFLRLLPAAALLWQIRGIGKTPWSNLKIPLRIWAIRPTRGLSMRPIADIRPAEEEDRS